MLKELLFYSTIGLGLGGCFYPGISKVDLTHSEQKKLMALREFNDFYFTDKARECLSKSPINLYKTEPGPFHRTYGFYIRNKRERALNYKHYEKGNDLEDTIIHESVHGLVDCGLLNKEEFMKRYKRIKILDIISQKYGKVILRPSIKAYVEDAIKRGYNPKYHDLDEERMAIFVAYWITSGFKVPREMEDFFKPIIKTEEIKGGIIKGLIGISID